MIRKAEPISATMAVGIRARRRDDAPVSLLFRSGLGVIPGLAGTLFGQRTRAGGRLSRHADRGLQLRVSDRRLGLVELAWWETVLPH
jgi:hypothetical protein